MSYIAELNTIIEKNYFDSYPVSFVVYFDTNEESILNEIKQEFSKEYTNREKFIFNQVGSSSWFYSRAGYYECVMYNFIKRIVDKVNESLNISLQYYISKPSANYFHTLKQKEQGPSMLQYDCIRNSYTGYVQLHDTNTLVSYYKGYVVNGKRMGEGKEYYENGHLKYDGSWKDDKYDGYGKYYNCPEAISSGSQTYWNSKSLVYMGNFKDGQYHGEGTEFYNSKVVRYQGQFKDGLYHGTGKFYDELGNVIHEGIFRNGEFVE